MLGLRLGAEFSHATKHNDLAVGPHLGKAADGGLHACGIGVVAVEQQLVVSSGLKLRAVVGGNVLFESLLYVEKIHLEKTSNGKCCHSVGEIVATKQPCRDVVNLVSILGVEREVWVRAEVSSNNISIGGTIGDNRGIGTTASFGAENLIVGIYEYYTFSGIEATVEFGLSADNTIETPETFEVSLSDTGDKTEVRLGDTAEGINLARMICSHLNNGHLAVSGDGEEGEWNTQMIVKVASCGMDTVATSQDSGKQLLGRGLAIGASNAYNGNGKMGTVTAGQSLQHREHIVSDDALWIVRILRIRSDAKRGTLSQSRGDKSVTVERGALESKEYTTLCYVAGVGSDST